MRVRQIMIFVHDLGAAKDFYHSKLGISIEEDLSKELGMLIMKNDGCILTIHEAFKQRPYEGDRKIAITFGVENIKQETERLRKLGVPMIGEIEESPIHWFQAMSDPSGNMIEIGQYK